MDSQTKSYLERNGVRLGAPDGGTSHKEVHIRGWGERFEFSDHCDEKWDLKAIRDGLRSEDPSFAAFLDWFHRHVVRIDGEEYRRAYWRLAWKYAQTLGNRPRSFDTWLFENREIPFGRAYVWHTNILAYFLAGGTSLLLWYIVKFLSGHIRRLRRPTYYQVERERRLALAADRRKIRRRTTLNPCPTPKMLREAFAVALRSNKDMIRFGSMLEDLECYVDNSLILDRETLRIKGRNGGIRRYLEANVPELAARYKTVMRYKALAKKFRQAVGVSDPIPASALLDGEETINHADSQADQSDCTGMDEENTAAKSPESRNENSPKHILIPEEAKALAENILGVGDGSFIGLEASLELLLNADCVNVADVPPHLAVGASSKMFAAG